MDVDMGVGTDPNIEMYVSTSMCPNVCLYDLQLNQPYVPVWSTRLYLNSTSVALSEPFTIHARSSVMLHFPTKAFQFLEVRAPAVASPECFLCSFILQFGDTETGSSPPWVARVPPRYSGTHIYPLSYFWGFLDMVVANFCVQPSPLCSRSKRGGSLAAQITPMVMVSCHRRPYIHGRSGRMTLPSSHNSLETHRRPQRWFFFTSFSYCFLVELVCSSPLWDFPSNFLKSYQQWTNFLRQGNFWYC